MIKAEINDLYHTHKQDILSMIQYKLIHWHTPICGYSSIIEYESDERYQFLMRSKHAIEEGLIRPEEDIVETGTSDAVFVQNAWFYQYWILKEKYKNEKTNGFYE